MAWPLEADPFKAYAVVRPLGGGEIAHIGSLFATVDDPHARKLLFPTEDGVARGESACYLAHAAFPDGLDVIHHLRLLVVNRREHGLRLPIETLTCDAASEPKRIAVVTADVEEVTKVWDVSPGEGRTLHVFYRTRGLDVEFPFAWELQGPPGPEGSPPTVGPWLFQVPLRRHYVCRDVELSQLERRVILGEVFPAAREPDAPWAEPLLTPVPGAAADGSAGD